MEFAGVESLSGRRGLVALAVLAAVGLAGGYAMAVRARPKPIRIPLAATAKPPAGPRASSGPAMEVHVAGAVASPGVYRLPAGSRVDDAVRVAGGARPDADLDAINLASKLRDGDKVVVPVKAQPGAPPGAGASAASGSADGRINLNTATVDELDKLPGIGPSLAERIIAWRTEHGGFRSVKDLEKVPGIGPRKFAELEEKVTV